MYFPFVVFCLLSCLNQENCKLLFCDGCLVKAMQMQKIFNIIYLFCKIIKTLFLQNFDHAAFIKRTVRWHCTRYMITIFHSQRLQLVKDRYHVTYTVPSNCLLDKGCVAKILKEVSFLFYYICYLPIEEKFQPYLFVVKQFLSPYYFLTNHMRDNNLN